MLGTMMNFPLTLNTILERAGGLFGKVEIVSRMPDKSLHRTTYGDVYRRARALAEALQKAGLKRGDRVATLMWNHYAHLESYFGIPAAGGVLHTLNLRLHPQEIARIANHARSRFVIVDDVLLGLWEQVAAHFKPERVIVVSISGKAASHAYDDYEALLEEQTDSLPAIDVSTMANELGCNFVCRSFAGDPKQMIALLKAALGHWGTSMFDVISPCVTFNNHDGSTKSYKYAKDHEEMLHEISYVPFFEQINVDYQEGETTDVALHDGSHIRLRKTDKGYDPTNKAEALDTLRKCQESNEFLTGLIYINESKPDFLTLLNTVDAPLATLPQETVQPSAEDLKEIMETLM